jgi:hypothetical protein
MTNILIDALNLMVAEKAIKPVKKNKDFIIDINDRGIAYIRALSYEAAERGLNPNEINRLEYGDLLVVKRENKNEVSLEYIDRKKFDSSPKNLPVFKLVEDWFEIMNKLDEVVKQEVVLPKPLVCCGCLLKQYMDSIALPFIVKDGQTVNTLGGKVSIFTTYVKIGYEIYDIYRTINTNSRFVFINDVRYEVCKDLFGKKYLQLS